MFYLTKKTIDEIKVGERCLVLADFSGVPAGTHGLIIEHYKTGVMVEWQNRPLDKDRPKHQKPLADGFHEDELEYLAFATPKHPTKAK